MFKTSLKTKNYKPQTNKGFTILEMIVVIGIFGLLTGIVVFRYGDFNSNILVTNMAYEVALTTRQAQVFGLGARGFKEDDLNQFQYPYGVFINLEGGAPTKKIALFVDRNSENEAGYGQCNDANGSGDCNCVLGDECLEQLNLQRNIRITELRVGVSNAVDTCENSPRKKLAITFKRPSPESKIEDQESGLNDYVFAQIKVEATSGDVKPAYVLIRESGQISVSQDDICVIEN